MPDTRTSRRAILHSTLAASALIGLGGRTAWSSQLPATPACRDAAEATTAQAEGPFYTADTPSRADFTGDGPGTMLMLAGFVVSRSCRPQPGAVVDIWHADTDGRYDNAGYRFRGHQLTDADGRFVFLTVVPGLYPGRTRHIHVKAQAPGSGLLTTQLYFPDERGNAGDRIYDPRLLMDVKPSIDHIAAYYDLVLDVG